jgi:hypothetical protein
VINPTDFTASVTHTVLYFRRDGSKYQNTATGEIGYGGSVAFDCGHSYSWRPLGDMTMPRRGDRDMCATCIEAALAALKTAAS